MSPYQMQQYKIRLTIGIVFVELQSTPIPNLEPYLTPQKYKYFSKAPPIAAFFLSLSVNNLHM